MPARDRTGPKGTGPIGWGFGPCQRGLRRRFLSWGSTDEKSFLQEQLKDVEAEKAAIEDRLKEL